MTDTAPRLGFLHRLARLAFAVSVTVVPAVAADLSVRELVRILFETGMGARPDLSGRSLEGLDLAGLDFKGARLEGADLFGADLTRADLARADLDGARLDRATVIRTNFTNASLRGAKLRTLTVSSTVEPDPRDAPRFTGADLTGAQFMARLDGTDFRGANLTDTRIGQHAVEWGFYAPRATLVGADFSAAKLRRTNLRKAVLHFARFVNADLIETDFSDSDLSGADFTGAELRGANFAGADLDGAIFKGVKDLDLVRGLDTARNADRIVR